MGEELPDIRQALAEVQAGNAGRVTTPEQILVRQARQRSGLTQAAFAQRIATPVATLRDWEQGRAWAFDDTIEHEAANHSDRDRTILIFDVWKPELTAEERDLVESLFRTIDAYGAKGAAWGV